MTAPTLEPTEAEIEEGVKIAKMCERLRQAAKDRGERLDWYVSDSAKMRRALIALADRRAARQPVGEMAFDQVVQDVAELGDRTSPKDWPEAMLVTAEELKAILRDRIALPTTPAPVTVWSEAEKEAAWRFFMNVKSESLRDSFVKSLSTLRRPAGTLAELSDEQVTKMMLNVNSIRGSAVLTKTEDRCLAEVVTFLYGVARFGTDAARVRVTP